MKDQKAELLQGTLDLLILKLLNAGPANGWELMQRIQVLSDDVIRVTPGSLYPALHRLEARTWIRAEWGASERNRRAKFYELTKVGRARLETERETWARFTGAVDAILKTS